jgi:hypothetical protein
MSHEPHEKRSSLNDADRTDVCHVKCFARPDRFRVHFKRVENRYDCWSLTSRSQVRIDNSRYDTLPYHMSRKLSRRQVMKNTRRVCMRECTASAAAAAAALLLLERWRPRGARPYHQWRPASRRSPAASAACARPRMRVVARRPLAPAWATPLDPAHIY